MNKVVNIGTRQRLHRGPRHHRRQYFPINANIGAAIRFHKQAIRAVELEKNKTRHCHSYAA